MVRVEEISELTFELQLKLNFLNSDFNDWGVVSASAKFNLDGVRRIGVVFDYFVAPKYPTWLSVQLGPGHRCLFLRLLGRKATHDFGYINYSV